MKLIAAIGFSVMFCAACKDKTPSNAAIDKGELRTFDSDAKSESGEPHPFDLQRNLVLIYESAVRDFAQYENTHRNPKLKPRTFRLDHQDDEIMVIGDSGYNWIPISPGYFDGVSFETALEKHLLNAGDRPAEPPNNAVMRIGVERIYFSQLRRQVQITLLFSRSMKESWTFLYDITDEGGLRLRKSLMLACSTPEVWIE